MKNNSNNSILPFVGQLILAVTLVVVSFLFLGKIDKFLKLTAIGDCGKISSYETTDESGAKVIYPVKQVYESCLKEKDY